MNKISRLFLKLILFLFFIISLIPCSILCILGYFLSFLNQKLAYFIQSFVAYSLWSIFNMIFKLSTKMNAPPIPNNNYLVISNHISAADFMIINSLNKYSLGNNKYSFKKSLLFLLPIFYPWAKSSNQLVLSRNFEKDKNEISNFIRNIISSNVSTWIILFSEGTRFTGEKKNLSDKFCIKNSIIPFKNVLCPRARGFSMLVEGLKGSQFKKILDLTFFTPQEGFSLFNVLFTPKVFTIECDVRILDLKAIESPDKFLFEMFRRKDDLIDQWKNGIKYN